MTKPLKSTWARGVPSNKDARRFVDCTRRQILVPVFSPARRVRIYQKKGVKENSPIFDPLGFLSPFTVRGKLLMQKTWTETVSWDEVLPFQLENKCKTWFGEWSDLAKIKISRCLKGSTAKKNSWQFTHLLTYAAAVYARYECHWHTFDHSKIMAGTTQGTKYSPFGSYWSSQWWFAVNQTSVWGSWSSTKQSNLLGW